MVCNIYVGYAAWLEDPGVLEGVLQDRLLDRRKHETDIGCVGGLREAAPSQCGTRGWGVDLSHWG